MAVDSDETIQIYRGFNYPTSFDFMPDGDILLATKSGKIFLVDKDSGNTTLVLNIEDRVNSNGDQGLLTLRVNKWNQPNVLVYYVVDSSFLMDPNKSQDSINPNVARLSEFSWVGSELDSLSEKIIIGKEIDPNCISEISPSPDCIPSATRVHQGGGLDFGSEENSIYLGIGDAAGQYPNLLTMRAQSLDSYNGKILRINYNNGEGFSSNPFASGSNLKTIKSKIFALGLRNPFRISIYPSSFKGKDRVFIGDVGWIEWEEINSSLGGENFGWPCFEGHIIPKNVILGNSRTRPSQIESICKTLVQVPPTRAFMHGEYNSITLGPVLTTESITTLHSTDYASKKYYTLDLINEEETLNTTFNLRSNDVGNIVDLRFDSNKILWFLDIVKGELTRLVSEETAYLNEISPYDIEINLSSPIELSPGQSIQFSGSITDKVTKSLIDVNRYVWSSRIVHCEPVCHVHPDSDLYDSTSGNFLMPEFHQASYVELSLSVFGTTGAKYSNSIRIDWFNSPESNTVPTSSGSGSISNTSPNLSVSDSQFVLPNPLKIKDSFFKSLSSSQMSSIPFPQFAQIPAKTIALLSPIQAVDLTFDQLRNLKSRQLVALRPGVISVLNSNQISALKPAHFRLMKSTQIAKIGAEASPGLSKSALNAFNQRQLRSLTTKAFKSLKPEVLKSLSVNKIRQFSPTQIRALTDEQKSALTETQKNSLGIN